MAIVPEDTDSMDEEMGFDNEAVGDAVEDSPESESESEEEEDVKLDQPSKEAIYNRDGLLDKLEDICWPKNVPWIHLLSIDVDQTQEVDVNDDLARELSFYTQALEGTRQAFEKFQSTGIPFLRPADYYAEMVKTDGHMVKVKGRLLAEKKKIEEAEERKKAREAKKLAKEVQAQKQKERTKQKKEEIEAVKKWRKQRQQSGFKGGDEEGPHLDFMEGRPFDKSNKRRPFDKSNKRRPGVSPGDRSGGKGKHGRGDKQVKGKMKKREFRESKFGYGGKKGMKKQNTADTTDDLRGFNQNHQSGNKKRKR